MWLWLRGWGQLSFSDRAKWSWLPWWLMSKIFLGAWLLFRWVPLLIGVNFSVTLKICGPLLCRYMATCWVDPLTRTCLIGSATRGVKGGSGGTLGGCGSGCRSGGNFGRLGVGVAGIG